MEDKQKLEQYLSSKISYHLLKSSLLKCSSDLDEFTKERYGFSDEQLFGIVAFSDHIKNQLKILNKELPQELRAKSKNYTLPHLIIPISPTENISLISDLKNYKKKKIN